MIIYRGSEQWNVAVMGFKNSSIYVQRQIDKLLRDFRSFAKAYIDDIVIFSNTLKEHLNHLQQVFALFEKYNIAIKSFKIFL